MRKIIFSINITIDGFADHTAVIADNELHDFFTDLLDGADMVLLGRKTYEMMASYWPFADQDPKSTKSELKFAEKYNNVSKLVFSKTLKDVKWNNTTLAKSNLIDEVIKLKNQNGKYIFTGSLSIASALAEKKLIDEYLLLIHPIVLGKGKRLFEDLQSRIDLKLIETKTFSSGVVVIHYQKNRRDLYDFCKKKPETIDVYINNFPEDIRNKLEKIRSTIKKAAPDAKEVISYQMPAFKFNSVLVYFAAFKNHIGLFPTPSPIKVFSKELSEYDTCKGTIIFPLDKKIPLGLISKITKYRFQEDLKKQNDKRKK